MMKTLLRVLALSGLSSLPVLATAGDSPYTLTANVGLYTQYIYRGLTQTARDPALQGGFDFGHSSGFYLGVWGSNVSWVADNYGKGGLTVTGQSPSASLEVDLYGGYKGSAGDLGYDVGVLQYWYPGSYPALSAGIEKPNTTEVYAAVSWKWLTGKLSYVVSDGLFGVDNADGSWYADLTASYPVAEGWTLVAHVGRQEYSGTACVGCFSNDNLYSYTDWKLGVTKDLGSGWSATAFYTDTDANDAFGGVDAYRDATPANGLFNDGKNLGDGHFVVGISRSF